MQNEIHPTFIHLNSMGSILSMVQDILISMNRTSLLFGRNLPLILILPKATLDCGTFNTGSPTSDIFCLSALIDLLPPQDCERREREPPRINRQ